MKKISICAKRQKIEKENKQNLKAFEKNSIFSRSCRVSNKQRPVRCSVNIKKAKDQSYRKFRYTNQVKPNIYSSQKFANKPTQMIQLKQYVNLLGRNYNQDKFRKKTPRLKTLKDSRLYHRQFLMRQISLSDFDQQKILQQKTSLEKFQCMRISVANLTGNEFEQDKDFLSCLRLINKIYDVLDQMEKMGFPLQNNLKGVRYCIQGKLWLKNVFLQESINRVQVFHTTSKYTMIDCVFKVRQNFAQMISNSKKDRNQLGVIREDINAFLDYLESALYQKKMTELDKISNYIQFSQKQQDKKPIFPLFVQKCKMQKINFIKDLKELEDRYGNMKGISKVTRSRYQNLHNVYNKLATID